jgi:hypothetical protein
MAEHLNSDLLEAQKWEMAFASGWDFFDDLRFKSDAEMRAHMPDAWHRLGEIFLDAFQPTPRRPTVESTFAWLEFGPP